MNRASSPPSRLSPAARLRLGLLALAACAAAVALAVAADVVDRDHHHDSGGRSTPIVAGSPEARVYLDAHNAVRATVRMPAGYTAAWAPIPPLAWSDEVAASAQDWANHLRDENECKLEHSDTRYGENLAGGKDVDATHAVQMWASEGEHYSWTPRYEFVIPTAHYTQVVWRKTTFVGCGRATCGHRAVVVCRYSPAGNYIDRAPY